MKKYTLKSSTRNIVQIIVFLEISGHVGINAVILKTSKHECHTVMGMFCSSEAESNIRNSALLNI